MGKHWTPEDLDYLERAWGRVAVKTIARHLNRSIKSVRRQAVKHGLGGFFNNTDRISLYSLLSCFGFHNPSSRTMDAWEKRGLHVFHNLVNKKRFRMVSLAEFWEWAEKNRNCMNFSLLEPLTLGAEPAWVKEQRKLDYRGKIKRQRLWTPAEDQSLEWFCSKGKTAQEMANELNRTELAVMTRCYYLGLRTGRRCKLTRWSPEEKESLLGMYREQIPLKIIAERLDRSVASVYGCLQRLANPGANYSQHHGLPITYKPMHSLREDC